MGLPTSAAYLLLAVLVAPALARLGLPPIVAHMFIFYFGLVSAITPPVALAAYAAAGIAGTDANATAWEAIRLGFVKLLVPFAFVTMPGLLMIGTPFQIVLSIVLATIRSEEHTSELQSLMRISYAVFCLKKKKHNPKQ